MIGKNVINTALRLILLAAAAVIALIPALGLCETESGETQEGVTEEQVEEELERQLKGTDLSAWDKWFAELSSVSGAAGEYGSVRGLVLALAEGDAEDRPGLALGVVSEAFLPGLRSALVKMAGVAAAAILTGLCGVAFEEGGIKRLVLTVIAAAAILSVTGVFAELAGETSAVIADIADFSEITSPILGSLLTAMGCTGSARLLAPRLAFIAGGAAVTVRGVIMPLLLASGVMTLLDPLTGGVKLERFAKLMRRAAKWLLGFLTAVYSAAAIAGGLGAGMSDGVSLRTARYALDKLIPATGGMVTGAVDAVRAGSLLLKNGTGIASLILLAGVLARPLVTVLCGMFALRIAAAATEPFSDERIPRMLDGVADTAACMFACTAASAAMFAVTVIMMIAAGGALMGA